LVPTVRAVVVEQPAHGCNQPWVGSVVPGTYVVLGPALYVGCPKWCPSNVLPLLPMPRNLPPLCTSALCAASVACALVLPGRERLLTRT
jgi:hypothetical protein